MTKPSAAAILVALLLAAPGAVGEVATGCLTRSGQIKKLAIGNEPQGGCGPRGTEITLRLGHSGDAGSQFQFVGVSTATATGNAGIFGLSTLCAEEFPGSRICMSREFIETVDPPPAPSAFAWIHPTFVGVVPHSDSRVPWFYYDRDISGAFARTCNNPSGGSGLIVRASSGMFSNGDCARALPVACCGP